MEESTGGFVEGPAMDRTNPANTIAAKGGVRVTRRSVKELSAGAVD